MFKLTIALNFRPKSSIFSKLYLCLYPQVIELKPGGADISVTRDNCIEYIHLVSHYKLNVQLDRQFQAFRQGLSSVVPLHWLRLFSQNELQVLISGARVPISVEDLRQHTIYSGELFRACTCTPHTHTTHTVLYMNPPPPPPHTHTLCCTVHVSHTHTHHPHCVVHVPHTHTHTHRGLMCSSYSHYGRYIMCVLSPTTGDYKEDHPVIKLFWEVVTSFSETEKRQLLKFVTSCSRPPLLGFKQLSPPLHISPAIGEERLPSASTCMNVLKLPQFQDSNTLRSKLLYAIQSGAGFELS